MTASPFSERVRNAFACPHCVRPLQSGDSGMVCPNCRLAYGAGSTGALDLRLQKDKAITLELNLPQAVLSGLDFDFKPLPMNPSAGTDLSKVKRPWNLSRELMSYFPKAQSGSSMMLDIGCGDTVHRELCEAAGFEYVGIDYHTPEAPILADAHALPFLDERFEFLISINVLEHCHQPLVAMREAFRVLQAGGKFIGVVAFMEPLHDFSFYHHTHLGVAHSLQTAGFKIETIAPSSKAWTVLRALAYMGYFPKMPSVLSKMLVFPLQVMHRIWWGFGEWFYGKEKESLRLRNFAGSIAFIASKD